MFILDTNVLSELMRQKPSARVVAWVAAQPARDLFTTAITEAEILYGIQLLAKGKRKEELLAAAHAVEFLSQWRSRRNERSIQF